MKNVLKLFVAGALLVLATSPVFADQQVATNDQQVVTAVAVVPAASPQALPALPASLAGRWCSDDNRVCQMWRLDSINASAGTALVTRSANTQANCNINKMPAALEWDGITLKVSAFDTQWKYMPCSTKLIVTMTKTVTKDGDEYSGIMLIDTTGTPYPFFVTTVR